LQANQRRTAFGGVVGLALMVWTGGDARSGPASANKPPTKAAHKLTDKTATKTGTKGAAKTASRPMASPRKPRRATIRLQVTQVRSLKAAQAVIERLRLLKCVKRAAANYRSGIAVVRYDPRACQVGDLVRHLKKAGYTARLVK
jgi:hypothetical protein